MNPHHLPSLQQAYEDFQRKLLEHAQLLTSLGLRSAHQKLPRVILVSKGTPSESIAFLHKSYPGLWFGENRLEELQSKQKSLESLGIRWVFVGALQSKKISKITALCSEIQSLSSQKHLEILRRSLSSEHSKPLRVLLQINVTGDSLRQGFKPREALELLKNLSVKKPSSDLKICGLMALPPLEESLLCYQSQDHKIYHNPPPSYQVLKELHKEFINLEAPELSLGMTLDWKVAMALGATTLRIGREIFFPHKINGLPQAK